MEHENRRFKANLKCYRGDYTQAHVDRISKGYNRINQIVSTLDKEIEYHPTSGKNKTSQEHKDLELLVAAYKDAGLTQYSANRFHSLSCYNICKNLMAGLNSKSLYK